MSEYSALYKYYDFLMRDYPYGKLCAYAKDKLALYGQAASGFELACGTGRFTAELSEAGYTMTASDISEDMLNLASERLRASKIKAVFLKQDINKLEISKRFDFAVSFTDGFNYISSLKNFDRTLGALNASIKDGGALIFDMSTLFKARNILSDKLYFEDREELTLFWRNSKISKRGKIEMSLTFFERESGGYVRYDESNEQYFYQKDDIDALLQKNGFRAEFCDGGSLGRLKQSSERMLVFAKKINGV
ncbi:MAG: class I SAM-dependent methyltransferase [Clostridiales bacterium]|jgi:ubiquinone/menaquinone biosynthesis C-methylase UbiE|nr:class I SAM-dependent methyltransferase [Clostridiales bacterium]